ncbi:hypothetical protein BP6252_00508 [Coleophoma cylindrospora]|uniref:Peroxidase n=1 Tax=Coleophoma cylindrospora TaxID=1849047 RepID=A0A3D8SQ81_9HELO|nr:hypothetical protein BP6252_00508 [Coleophoma cylindrospora]
MYISSQALWILAYLPWNILAAPRPSPRVDDGSSPGELIGDLLDGITTPTGQLIANILIAGESGQSQLSQSKPSNCPPTDPCCVWYDVSAALTKLFLGRQGVCNDAARAAIRLGFHDAGTWSKTNKANGQDFGGADGSILLGFGEDLRKENNGLQAVIVKLQAVRKKYQVGAADLIQFAANHATVTCPLGPRVRTFVGRKDATQAAPQGLLPSMFDSPDNLIALFQDKTIQPHGLAALVGAHSASKQFTQNLALAGQSQDSTPGIWDVTFYNETLQAKPAKKLFIFPSDIALANHPSIESEWQSFINDQLHWNEDYASEYVRLSLLGVNNINSLTECTIALPQARPSASSTGADGVAG